MIGTRFTRWALDAMLLSTLIGCADGHEKTMPADPEEIWRHHVHLLTMDEGEMLARDITRTQSNSPDGRRVVSHISRVIRTDFPVNSVVPSWNIDVPPGGGFAARLRLGREVDDFWTPHYDLGAWGDVPDGADRIMVDSAGRIDVDYFLSDQRFDRIQYSFDLVDAPDGRSPVLRRVALALSNTLGDAELAAKHRQKPARLPNEKWCRRIDVPFRSQRDESPELRSRVCSPTSVAMVLAYHGMNVPTSRACEVVYDPRFRIYGNWWRAVQGAYTLGVPGYLERFNDFEAVKRHIAAGRPVIASIRVGKGQLPGAPYRQSDGHLLVITGFDDEGNVHVNDPAAPTRAEGVTTYDRAAMEAVWFANRGVGYVLEAP